VEGGLLLEAGHQIVHHQDETGPEYRAREIPLPIPVRVRDQVKDEARHPSDRISCSW
jgi:hypothetical protein